MLKMKSAGKHANCKKAQENMGTFHFARPTGQRPVGYLRKNDLKMERHFPIKPGQPRGMALTVFYSFTEFPI